MRRLLDQLARAALIRCPAGLVVASCTLRTLGQLGQHVKGRQLVSIPKIHRLFEGDIEALLLFHWAAQFVLLAAKELALGLEVLNEGGALRPLGLSLRRFARVEERRILLMHAQPIPEDSHLRVAVQAIFFVLLLLHLERRRNRLQLLACRVGVRWRVPAERDSNDWQQSAWRFSVVFRVHTLQLFECEEGILRKILPAWEDTSGLCVLDEPVHPDERHVPGGESRPNALGLGVALDAVDRRNGLGRS
mmetsp:Transcript_42691/g.106429  ORF Transcript_42691/g.106429 Transcript_42691/m.106429 type:complete len:248 (-) Transcript_42691:21-764(-)